MAESYFFYKSTFKYLLYMYMLLEMELSLCGDSKSILDFTDHGCFKLCSEEKEKLFAGDENKDGRRDHKGGLPL